MASARVRKLPVSKARSSEPSRTLRENVDLNELNVTSARLPRRIRARNDDVDAAGNRTAVEQRLYQLIRQPTIRD